MCDSITNGFSQGGCGSVVVNNCQPSIPPMIYISNGNTLNTFYGLSASNLYSCNSFTTDLYISGNVYGANLITANVTTTLNATTIVSGAYYGNASGLSNLNASNLFGTFSNTNLPFSGVTPGQYGSSANVFQGTVDQYGLITQAANIAIIPTQWTSIDGNVAYQNGVSIGIISNPPPGSNLYVLGTANIDTLNVGYLTVNSAVVYGASTLNVYGVSNLNTVIASLYSGNASGLSNLTGANVLGTVGTAGTVTGNAQPNITSVGILSALTVTGLLTASNGSGISNLNASNVLGTVGTAVAVTGNAQPNITSVGTLSSLSVSGLIAGTGQALSSITGSNVSGTVGSAQIVTQSAQSAITSVGILTGLTVAGLLIASDASGLSNIPGSNVVGAVPTAVVVTANAQPNITSVGVLSALAVSGLITGTGQALSAINGSNVVGAVGSAQVVTQAAQPNITSVGTLTSLAVSGMVTAGSFAGDGSALSNLSVSNIVGTVAFATTAGAVTGNAQPNITSVGTLSSLSVTGSLIGGTISGDGVGLTNIPGAAIVGAVSLASSVSTAAQTNITSVGTLTSLAVSGLIVGSGQALSNIQSANIVGTIPFSTLASAVTGNAQTNITSLGTLSGLNVSGVLFGGLLTGNASGLSNLQASNIVGTVGTALSVTAPAQPNITSVGILSNLAVSNSVTTNNVFANFANVSGKAIFGTVGIGIANPYGQLEVSSPATSTSVSISLSDASTGSGSGGTFLKDATQNVFVINYQISDLILQTNSTNRMRMYSAGGQGILGPLGVGSTLTPPSLTSATLQVTGNIYASNSVSTPNVLATTANVGTLNVISISNLNSLTLGTSLATPLANVGTLNVWQVSNLQGLTLGSNLSVPTANVGTLNVLTISNLNSLTLGTSLATPLANVGTLNVWQVSNLQGLTIGSNLFVPTANITTLNASSIFGTNSNLVSANITTLTASSIFGTNSNLVSANITTLTASSIFGTNSNLVSANVTTLTASSIFGTNSNLVSANVTTLNASSIFGTNSNLVTANITTLNAFSIFGTNSNLTTLNASSISVTTQANIFSSNLITANVGTLNTSFLTVTSNILSGPLGNTYITGNVVVSGNVFSSLGSPLGAGGGYYLSLPTDIALQPAYTGPVGTARPLSVGLSNGFTINGTSTFITVTSNGNFKFSQAGPYMLSAVFSGSDNLLGLAVGSNVADIHGTDQGYLYRYTTFVSQNPTELIKIPIDVTDATKYYYLDLFAVDGGTLHQTGNTSGGTYLTITPLTGGGLATGGPGGTPGTQWISSASNIYFPNSVGVGGAPTPGYKLDVTGDLRVTGNIIGTTLVSVVSGLTSNYIANVGDCYIGVNGARKVTLPLGSSVSVGKSYIVKDEAGNASVTSVLLQASGSDTIDGNSNVTMALNNISLTPLWTGTRWSLI